MTPLTLLVGMLLGIVAFRLNPLVVVVLALLLLASALLGELRTARQKAVGE